MEELFNLTYKDEVEKLKELDDFEQLGDQKYIHHKDFEARLYWAFCRPSGSHPDQISDPHPLVSIMAFNHSRLGSLKRFKLLHKDVIKDDDLRKKIKNRTRMLFRDLVDNDFKELNQVLDFAPVFIEFSIDQLKHGRMWNDIAANELEATKFLEKIKTYDPKIIDESFLEPFYLKLQDFEEFDEKELKKFLTDILNQKDHLDPIILQYYQDKGFEYIQNSTLHILQKKSIEMILKKL